MNSYELSYLISSLLTEDEAVNIQEKTVSFVKDNEGILIENPKLQRKRLAYPIRKNTNAPSQTLAYLAVLGFQIAPNRLKDLEKFLKEEASVLRHLIVVKDFRKIERKSRPFPARQKAEETAGETATTITQRKKVELKEIDKTIEEILNESK